MIHDSKLVNLLGKCVMLWIEAFHVIFVICWFAGIFYLPRLFVYHTMADDRISQERFSTMERKLYYGIMTPCAILTIVFGIWLVALNPSYYLYANWFYAKLILVLLLIAYHLYCGHCYKRFKQDKNSHSHTFYRILNEIPTLLLVAIVILVIVKP